jgi:hypothetical protein
MQLSVSPGRLVIPTRIDKQVAAELTSFDIRVASIDAQWDLGWLAGLFGVAA